MRNLYFIDFENIQNFAYESLNKNEDMVVIFVGHVQSKINFDIVSKTQKLGDSVHWIKMAGSGRNSLDFHIAYYLGYFISAQEEKSNKCKVFIVSNDGDYDVLIKHIQENGIQCERITTKVNEQLDRPLEMTIKVEKSTPIEKHKLHEHSEVLDHLLSSLKKQDKLKRPRTLKTLSNHIVAQYKNKKDGLSAEKVLDLLISNKKISVNNDRITYKF